MRFGPVPLELAEGKILGHNVAGDDGRRVLRKGIALRPEDIARLRELGRSSVYVAELDADDVTENAAAARLGRALSGPHIRDGGASTGRVNLYAERLGLLRVDVAGVAAVNGCPGVTLATLPGHSAVTAGKMVATLKILPYGLPSAVVARAETHARSGVLRLDPLSARRVSLILSGSPASAARVRHGFETALQARLAALGASIVAVDFIPLEDEAGERALAGAIGDRAAEHDLIILAGETAIMDRYDIAPRAVERAGGAIACVGAPVDPGNLLMLAYHGDVPVLGAPGCARSPKVNIVDLLLPRLLAGDRLTQADIVALGHGGLLEDVPERPAPRSRLE